MATISLACNVNNQDHVCQGDVFKDVKYNYINRQTDDEIEIVEFEFPMAIVISQACDVNSSIEMFDDNSGKPTKFMPSILMCPIYDKEEAKSTKHLEMVFDELLLTNKGKGEPLFTSKEYGVAENDWHYRFHALTVKQGKDVILDTALLDYKHYFTVPPSYLYEHRADRLFRLEGLFAEQITLKFATYLSRVAIP